MIPLFTLSNGAQMPALAWGSGTGGLIGSGLQAIEAGVVALKKGIRHIDTAQSYYTEAEAADSIDQSGIGRDHVWLTSKISEIMPVTTPEAIKQSVLGSLTRLREPPNLLLIHNPHVIGDGKIAEFWTILEGLVDDGTLKGCSLGVSNFRPQDLEQVFSVAKYKPVCNQLEYHPYVLAQMEGLMELQKQHGIVTMAYGPLTPILRHPTGGPLQPVLERIVKRFGDSRVDSATVLLLWLFAKGHGAVTTSNKEANIEKLAALKDIRALTPAEVEDIDRVGKTIHFRHYTEHMDVDFPIPNLPSDVSVP